MTTDDKTGIVKLELSDYQLAVILDALYMMHDHTNTNPKDREEIRYIYDLIDRSIFVETLIAKDSLPKRKTK